MFNQIDLRKITHRELRYLCIMKNGIRFVWALAALLTLAQCRKDIPISQSPDHRLEFSTDTVFFDTVFTTIGSSTRRMKVFNPHSDATMIESIAIAGGESSPFRLNVNGDSGKEHRDVLIQGSDSIYLFAEVTIDPNQSDAPLVHEDSLIFITNGNVQTVRLVAWGQDAYFYYPTDVLDFEDFSIAYSIIDCNDVWQNDKPHVIYGYAVADTDCELIIEAGTQVHLHDQSALWVFDGGSLKVQGALENEVVFQGDRLEPAYEEVPGQWGFIWLSAGSIDNSIDHAVIKNGIIGLRVDTVGASSEPTLRISNTEIRNMESVGLLGYGSVIRGDNLLISECGDHCLALSIGGDYRFTHCTFANYWGFPSRQTATVLLNNYYEAADGTLIYRDLTQARFNNCIIWGSNLNEVTWDQGMQGVFNWKFDHTAYRSVPSDWPDIDFTDTALFHASPRNLDPVFTDVFLGDFTPDSLSPVIDLGDPQWAQPFPLDLRGNDRTATPPDLGAIEVR